MSRKSRLKAYDTVLSSLVNQFNATPPEQQRKLFKQWVYVKISLSIVCLSCFFYLVILYLVQNSNQSNLGFISAHSGVATLLFVSTGVLLYLLRTWFQYIYGILEIGFAIASLWYLLKSLPVIGNNSWVAIFGAVYVLVRGIDNLICGFKEPIKKSG